MTLAELRLSAGELPAFLGTQLALRADSAEKDQGQGLSAPSRLLLRHPLHGADAGHLGLSGNHAFAHGRTLPRVLP